MVRRTIISMVCPVQWSIALFLALSTGLIGASVNADPGGSRLLPRFKRPKPAQLTAISRATALKALPDVAAGIVRASGSSTTVQLLLTGRDAQDLKPVITLRSHPNRLVIDLGDVVIAPRRIAPPTVQRSDHVQSGTSAPALSIGLAAPARVHAILALRGPVRVVTAELVTLATDRIGPLRQLTRRSASPPREAKAHHLLSVTIESTDEATFAAAVVTMPGMPPSSKELRPSLSQTGDTVGGPRVVVIDAGHGGADPGALASDGTEEKTIVLAVAKQVRAYLETTGRYRVVMTRDRDVFVSLERRVDMSQAASADVFVSLHADAVSAVPGAIPEAIRGASIYTLSDRASSEDARRLADRENDADLVVGRSLVASDPASDIREILIDLTRAETQGLAADLRGALVAELKRSIAVAREPSRSAAFRVLRQPRTPSVLIELGYMTNARDQAQMTTVEWQRRVASSIAVAIDRFLRRGATAP